MFAKKSLRYKFRINEVKLRSIKMIVVKKLHIAVLFFVLSVLITPFLNFFSPNAFEFETSVWCFSGSNQTKFCKFRNICYDPQFKTLLFFLGKGTVIKGFSHYSELQKIQLSSVQYHNQFYANLSLINIENYNHSRQLKIYPKILLFSRFKPNNIMHSIHDDLFPAFLTLESACFGDVQCIESFSLMFHDNHPKGPFYNFYKAFSKEFPIILNELLPDSNYLFCARNMLTGLVLDSVVYQYGFKKPHGPVKPSHLNQNDISRFILFLKNKLHIDSQVNNISEVILLKRVKNRKILNVEEVKKMVLDTFQKLNKKVQVTVISLDLFSNDLSVLIKIISQADGLIAMHGAEMILSLFLKPKSYVIEIFPFGIEPEVVSFVKPISEMSGCNFKYFCWRNMLKNNSVAHANAHPYFGGIWHLDETSQEKIKNAQEVPPVECCNNPLFLYHMYQDTLISNQFENFFYEILAKIDFHAESEERHIIKKWFYPYTVFNFSCNFQMHKRLLQLSWRPPFNAENSNLRYSLHIKDQRNLFNKDFFTEKTTLEVETFVGISTKFEVWISVYLNNSTIKSPDFYSICY